MAGLDRSSRSIPLEIREHRRVADLHCLRPEWRKLVEGSSTGTIFSTWEWLVPWWRTYGNDDQLLVYSFHLRGELVGLAPLSIRRRAVGAMPLRVVRLLGDGSEDSDNLELLVRSGFEPDVVRELLTRLRDRGGWDLCEFNTMPEDSVATHALWGQLQDDQWLAVRSKTTCWAIELPGDWEGYLRQLSKKERGKVRYYTRRLHKDYEVAFSKCSTRSELGTYLETLFGLHQKRWQQRASEGCFRDAARRQFYKEMSGEFLDNDWLELWQLKLDGVAVAIQFGFRYRDTVFSLQEGFDPEYASDAVGYVLRAHVLKDLISRGIRRYDFLGGEGHHKARWQAKRGHYQMIHFARRLSVGGSYLMARRQAEQAKQWLRAHLRSARGTG